MQSDIFFDDCYEFELSAPDRKLEFFPSKLYLYTASTIIFE